MSSVVTRCVSVAYDGRCALDGFTDTVDAGEWLGVIGPNGAGKSSLLRAIAGLVAFTGLIEIDGIDLSAADARERARLVAYVPQQPVIPPEMRVREYVLLGRWAYTGRFGLPRRNDHAVVDDTLEQLGLGEFAVRPLGELSGGERQRVVLARALAQQAPALVLDEPTSALDIGHQQQALELVAELRSTQQLTVLSALHDLTLAGLYADRLTMLDRGRTIATGSAAEVLTAERLGDVYRVCVTVDVEPGGDVVVVPRRGFPLPDGPSSNGQVAPRHHHVRDGLGHVR